MQVAQLQFNCCVICWILKFSLNSKCYKIGLRHYFLNEGENQVPFKYSHYTFPPKIMSVNMNAANTYVEGILKGLYSFGMKHETFPVSLGCRGCSWLMLLACGFLCRGLQRQSEGCDFIKSTSFEHNTVVQQSLFKKETNAYLGNPGK